MFAVVNPVDHLVGVAGDDDLCTFDVGRVTPINEVMNQDCTPSKLDKQWPVLNLRYKLL